MAGRMGTEAFTVTTCDTCGKQVKLITNKERLPVEWRTIHISIFDGGHKHLRGHVVEACSQECAARRIAQLATEAIEKPSVLFGAAPMPDGAEGD